MTTFRRVTAGAAIWLGYLAATLPNPQHEGWTLVLLLLAVLVLVPLALDLFIERHDAPQAIKWLGWVRLAHLPAGALLALACWLPSGIGAGLLALPWLAVTALLAATGVVRSLRHGFARPLDRLCTDAALMFMMIGGLWVLADRLGVRPMSFDAAIVALTAVHFHYAGFLLPLFTGLVGRQMPESRFVARAAVGVVLGVPAVAVGITVSQLGWGSGVETAAGLGLALAGAVVAILHVRLATEPTFSLAARMLLGIAGVSLFFGMVFAGLYAIRMHAAPLPWLGIPQMRALHGTLNALGFGLCGVLGWRAALEVK